MNPDIFLKQLNNNDNWVMVSNKNIILENIKKLFKKDDEIIDIIEVIYKAKNNKSLQSGIHGILCLTKNNLFFLSGESGKNNEILALDKIFTIDAERGFSFTGINITYDNNNFSFDSVSKEKSCHEFIKKINSLLNFTEIPAENIFVKNDKKNIDYDNIKNYNFLYNEAKKIFSSVHDIIKTENDYILEELLINDLTILTGICLSDNIKKEEKFFSCLSLVPFKKTDLTEKKLIIIKTLKDGITDIDSVIECWDIIKDNFTDKIDDFSSISLLSLDYLSEKDFDKTENNFYRFRTLCYNYCQCLIKADQNINEEEELKLKKIFKLIYKEKTDKSDKTEAGEKIQKENENAVKETPPEKELTLEEVMADINKLIGMDKIKEQIATLINLIKVQKAREERNLPISKVSLHSVFYGPPGTGKTTIARLLGKVFKCLGILKKGQLIETDRAGLVAGYVGQTAIKTDELINKALDGILFIDEAYSLKPREAGNDFGQEAIDILLKRMEDHRDKLIVIVAGYTDEMNIFIESNPGLKSRFNRYFYFDHYIPDDLMKIYDIFCKNSQFKINKSGSKKLSELFTKLYDKRDKTFGNGRLVRNLFERTLEKQANRIASITPLTDEVLSTITESDIPEEKEL